MKSNYFKIAMPVLAVVLAIGGSFASKASEQSTAAKITGYITPFGRPACSITVQCSNLPGPACSAFYQGDRKSVV